MEIKIQVKDLVDLMLPRYESSLGARAGDEDLELGKAIGYNQCLSEVSSLPISKDKVIGMVQLDPEKIKDALCQMNFDQRCEWFNFIKTKNGDFHLETMLKDMANAIIQSKSDILTIKGDV